VTRWDAATGKVSAVDSQREGERTVVQLDMPPVGSHLLVFGLQPQAPPRLCTARSGKRLSLTGWSGKPMSPNVAILDRCAYRIGEREWSETMYVQRAFKSLREHFGLVHDNGNRGVQFWLAYQRMKPLAGNTRIALRYEFDCHLPPDAPVFFVTETPERFRISVNRQPVNASQAEEWLDQAFRRIPIAGLVREGRNEVLVLCEQFAEDVEIEACYLVGEFSAEWDGRRIALRAAPPMLTLGDWCTQGYRFYAGSVAYRVVATLSPTANERTFLCLGQWAGAVARVRVNGRDLGPIAWPPYELDITDALTTGQNELIVEVFNTLRNLLGPHHRRTYVPGMVAPNVWFEPDNWRDDYDLLPYGLLNPPWLEKRATHP
jgi:hypothetical protein